MITRRQFSGSIAALTALQAQRALSQPALIDQARIVIGFPPGGTMDALARSVSERLRGSYAKTVIVDNRPGAGGQIAATLFKDYPADGTSLLLQPSSVLTIYPHTYSKLQYSIGQFTAVSTGTYTDHGLAVGPAVPEHVRSLPQLATWLNANPEKATFGNPGAGSMSHMIATLATKHFGIGDPRHAPYRGTAPGVQDLLGGQITAFCGPIGDYLQHRGKLRVLAIAGRARSPFLPEVPTLSELGHDLVAREWYGFFLPARTLTDTVVRVGNSLISVLARKEVVEAMAQVGMEVQSSMPKEFAAQVLREASDWERLVKSVGFTSIN